MMRPEKGAATLTAPDPHGGRGLVVSIEQFLEAPLLVLGHGESYCKGSEVPREGL
jgi:hypothetical protein